MTILMMVKESSYVVAIPINKELLYFIAFNDFGISELDVTLCRPTINDNFL